MILVCNNEPAAEQVLDATPIEQISIREQRLLAMLGKKSITEQELKNGLKWQTINQQLVKLSEDYA
ncbi:MAG: hypothetical protein DRQ62_13015 [Gammaproteobacteria bacterium]|nr:MAG: hypothetical protein DRQ62_13015 [Gammaproteobacteria bacterium]